MGEFVKNTDYTQLEQNTVDSRNQLKESKSVRFYDLESNGLKVMFVGNSITLHGILPSIGWHGEWGMAASSKEKDYVHLLMSTTREKDPDCSFCICQVAEWERQYKNGKSLYNLFENARNFNADIIVMRFVENCPKDDFDKQVFKTETVNLLNHLNPSNAA